MGKIRENSIQSSNHAELISIYDVLPFDHPNKNIRKCNSYQELLDSGVDAVIVSAYAKVSSEYVIRALTAGKHVFCEKPPSISVEEILQVIQAEKACNQILKYGFNHRYHYSVMEAKKLINTGALGKLLWMRGIYGKAGSIDFQKNWRNYKQYSGGGILLDQGIHMLDLFRYFTNDEFHCLSSCLTRSYWDIEFEDNAFLTLISNRNIIATLHSSANQWKHKFLLEMTFEKGHINLDGILSETRSYSPETLVVGERELENIIFAMGKPKETITYFESDRSWDIELEEFIKAIRGESPVINGTSYDAFEIMKLIDQAYSSNTISKEKDKLFERI